MDGFGEWATPNKFGRKGGSEKIARNAFEIPPALWGTGGLGHKLLLFFPGGKLPILYPSTTVGLVDLGRPNFGSLGGPLPAQRLSRSDPRICKFFNQFLNSF